MHQAPQPMAALRRPLRKVVGSGAHLKRGFIELAFLSLLYVGYSASRLLASNDFQSARGRAVDLLDFEKSWRIAIEQPLNTLFADHGLVGLFGSFWYASTHYFVTAAVLVWLYRRGAGQYVTARRALVLATITGLGFYLLVPTAPPRLIGGGYIDILSRHAQAGWWGADASAPRGLGDMTNELAAMPSLHAGWALWVAIVLIRANVRTCFQHLGALYALTTAVVVIGTANHWVVDAVAGWIVVAAAWAVIAVWEKRSPVAAHEEFASGWPPRVAQQCPESS